MLKELRVRNFKALRGATLKLKPLTILLGENGSGKSSFLEALAFAKQTRLGVPSKMLDGYYVELGHFDDVAFKDSGEIEISASFKLSKDDIESIKDSYEREKKKALGEEIVPSESLGFSLSFSEKEVVQRLTIDGKDIFQEEKPSFRCSSSEIFLSTDFIRIFNDKEGPVLYEYVKNLSEILWKSMSGVYNISSLRGNVPRYKDIQKRAGITPEFDRVRIEEGRTPRRMGDDWVGTKGECTLEILAKIFKSMEFDECKRKIVAAVKDFGIFDLHAGSFEGVSSDYSDPVTETTCRVSHSGFGSRQLLPVIVQIFYAKRGSTIMIEEPEISLHVKAQQMLLKHFADAVSEGKQVIITTHSEHLPLSLREVIPEKIGSDDVAVYHLRKEEDGVTSKSIDKLPVSREGAIKGWIPSFVEAEQRIIEQVMH